MSQRITFLAELRSQILAVEDMNTKKCNKKRCRLRLILQHLYLSFQTSPIVLTRAFQVVVHLLHIGHQVGQVRTFHRKSFVLVE